MLWRIKELKNLPALVMSINQAYFVMCHSLLVMCLYLMTSWQNSFIRNISPKLSFSLAKFYCTV